MELIKNIFFNTDKLTANSDVKISYTGKFFDDKSEKVFLHYGFNEKPEKYEEIEMKKSELGFQAEIKLTEDKLFVFYFSNNKNEIDNNNGENYKYSIEPESTENSELDEIALLPARITKFYLWKKKLRINFYKVVTYLPKLISGKYKRKLNNTED